MAIYKWNRETINEGLDRFNQENGHYPTALEIDKTSYLPSSRQIQRRFGGLISFRKLAGHEVSDFGSGSGRSGIATRAGARGLSGEREVEKILIELFGEEFVHVEKRWGSLKQRLDFFVYNPKNNFAVDVISASSIHSLIVNLNIKIPRYSGFPHELYFVVVGPGLIQEKLDKLIRNKKSLFLSTNEHLVSIDNFLQFIDGYPRYTKK